jgi:DNA invertase Pin-like site-specific DNA recombinase
MPFSRPEGSRAARTAGRRHPRRSPPPDRRPHAAGKKHIGRPRAVDPAELRQLQRMTSEGTTVTQAARILKVSRSTAYAALASTR